MHGKIHDAERLQMKLRRERSDLQWLVLNGGELEAMTPEQHQQHLEARRSAHIRPEERIKQRRLSGVLREMNDLEPLIEEELCRVDSDANPEVQGYLHDVAQVTLSDGTNVLVDWGLDQFHTPESSRFFA